MLKPFKNLWRRDRSANKEKALMELAYIYFMEDSRSDYQVYIDREERSKQVTTYNSLCQNFYCDKKHKPHLGFLLV